MIGLYNGFLYHVIIQTWNPVEMCSKYGTEGLAKS